MSNTAIKVENVSKQYRLGTVGTGTISHDVNRWWHRVRGKEDPYLKIGEENDRTVKGNSDYVWALKDIDFEVKHGEVLGIIGRNGAGKSTLLKILSRTTKPTTGQIKIHGRIASLLEVGTGFHPELSGRDNIFLNGAILGMTKMEIKRKFDEIVAFSGVEKYIDTPVKRYSSGMYVRLAFAVAAHLESEIVIVDEVLAVGDYEFQKKCLGKMRDLSDADGRTVLFVSHNLLALEKICSKGILLSKGKMVDSGPIDAVIKNYSEMNYVSNYVISGEDLPNNNNDKVRLIKAWVEKESTSDKFLISDKLDILFEFEVLRPVQLNLSLIVYTQTDEHLLSSPSLQKDGTPHQFEPGIYRMQCTIPAHFFNTSRYNFTVLFVENLSRVLLKVEHAFSLEFEEDVVARGNYIGIWNGLVRPQLDWSKMVVNNTVPN